jgi:predicted polyphosphate/ATP-dependent NAD kinase
MAEESVAEAYGRGVTAGDIAARLAGHDRHFATINGSLGDLVVELRGLRSEVTRTADRAEQSARTVLDTAAAVRAAGDRAWLPWSRTIALVAAGAAVASIVISVIALR